MRKSVAAGLLLPAVLMLALVLASAGCGGKADPDKVLRDALAKSSEASSMQADILVETEPEGGARSMALTLEGEAAVDLEAQAASISFQVMGFDAELRHVDGEDYLKLGGTWYTLGGAGGDDFFSGLGQGVSEAAFFHPQLLGQYTRVVEQDSEKVSGQDCYRFEVSLDPKALAELEPVKKIGGMLGVDPSDLASSIEDMAPLVDVWVGKDDGYIRKIVVGVGVDAGGALGIDLLSGRTQLKATAVFNDYNQPLDIEAPSTTSTFDPDLLPF